LQELRSEINGLNSGDDATGVVASILQVSDNDFRLLLTKEETGEDMAFTDAAGDYFSQLQASEQAQFTIDGISMTRSSNTVDDAIPGLTLNLQGEDDTTALTLEVGRDNDEITGNIRSFVNAYNDVMGYINQQMKYNEATERTGGALFGDNTLKSIKSNLQNLVVESGLSAVGITTGNDNKLNIDADELEDALNTDFEGTVSLFNSMATVMDDSLDNVTDSIDGTVALQKENLQSGMDRLDERIASAREHVDRRMQLMTDQFVSMETALTQMQSQSSYLMFQLGTTSLI